MSIFQAVFTALSLSLVFSAADDMVPRSGVDEARAILTHVASFREACGGFTCNTECLLSIEHEVEEDEAGEDLGGYHDCMNTGDLPGCEYHECDPNFAMHDIRRLATVLPDLDPSTLARLSDEQPALLINHSRSAVQVLGCEDRILLTMPISLE